MSRASTSPTQPFVAHTPSTPVRFRVLTPDQHPIALTVEPTLAAATALAVARHHPFHSALIAATDGRWLEIGLDGHTTLTPPSDDQDGWWSSVQRALERLAPTTTHS
ncbi:MAG: hypothetical protein R8G01_01410 [Ilumatobacteraceae bacterium]|nr:hypothetical protein [Ilumatobacteraceae bacterium]